MLDIYECALYPCGPVQHLSRKIAFSAAFGLLILSTSSCASLANYIWSGRWEDPDAQEAKPTPPTPEKPGSEEPRAAAPNPDKDKPQKTNASARAEKPIEEKKLQALPIDTVFTHGSWFLLRTKRAFYSWTGKGEAFRLLVIELHADATCWGSQQADRPAAEHCPANDGPASPDPRVLGGFLVESMFSLFEKAPWKTAQTGTALQEGTYDLPESSGKEKSAFTLHCKADEMIVRTSRALDGAAFTLPSAGNAFLVQGQRPDLFDGCTDANGILPVYDEVGIRFGKKKCGIFRRETEYSIRLVVDKAEVEFTQTSKAPDIADARVRTVKLRKIAADNKAQLILDISGDASHTIFTAMMKRLDGEENSLVEGVRTIDDVHHKCGGSIAKMDAAWVRTAKQVCGAMVKLK